MTVCSFCCAQTSQSLMCSAVIKNIHSFCDDLGSTFINTKKCSVCVAVEDIHGYWQTNIKPVPREHEVRIRSSTGCCSILLLTQLQRVWSDETRKMNQLENWEQGNIFNKAFLRICKFHDFITRDPMANLGWHFAAQTVTLQTKHFFPLPKRRHSEGQTSVTTEFH
jgi:hypothetical protein